MISHSDVLKKPNPWHWMRANLNLVVELNVHGNRQYETVVLARVAKFEALCLRLEAQRKAETAEAENTGTDLEEENLLFDEDTSPDKQFIVTDLLLRSSDDANFGEAPDKNIDEYIPRYYQPSMMENSVIDMRNEIDFELVTDPSLIVVQNIATGENNLTVFSLKEIRLGYF